MIASATKLLREEGGRRPETRSRWRRIYDLWPFLHYTVLFGDRMYCFCGGVASFNVFCVLVTYPPGLGLPAGFFGRVWFATGAEITLVRVGVCRIVALVSGVTSHVDEFIRCAL